MIAKDNKDITTYKVHRHPVMKNNDLIQTEIKSLLNQLNA